MAAQGMPPHLLTLFAPRPPLPYEPPLRPLFERTAEFAGMSSFVDLFETTPPPPVEKFITPKEAKAKRKQEALEAHKAKQQKLIEEYDPLKQECATKNPFATLFVGRLSYETTERRLRREFERFGQVRRIKIITDRSTGKSRGYGFVEFETEDDFRLAYKKADGAKIDGRRILVDVERSRTIPTWLPRRLGGGRGPPRFRESKKAQAAHAAATAANATPATGPVGGPHSTAPLSHHSNYLASPGGSGHSNRNYSYRGGGGGGPGPLPTGPGPTSNAPYMSPSDPYSSHARRSGGGRMSHHRGRSGGGGHRRDSGREPPRGDEYYRHNSAAGTKHFKSDW